MPVWSTSGTTSTELKPASTATSRKRMLGGRAEIGNGDRLARGGGLAERRVVGVDGAVAAFGALSMPIDSVS